MQQTTTADGSTEVNFSQLPSYIVSQLAKPPTAPRHVAIRNLALQLVGEGVPDPAIFTILRRWCPDLDKTDEEIRRLIRGAHNRNPRPANVRRDPPNATPFQPSGKSEALPFVEVAPIDFFKRIFGPLDNIEIAWRDDRGKLNQCEIKTVDEWDWNDNRVVGSPDGLFYCINPLVDGAKQHDDDLVADYRHLLIELEVAKEDRGKMDPEDKEVANEKFFAALKETGLPFAAIYTSGDASVHGLVKINAAKREEWYRRMERVYSFCAEIPGFDTKNKNPSRLSRLPGAMRGKCLQTLLSWELGAATYEEWERSVELNDGVRRLQGHSPLHFANLAVEPEDRLLGDRWLCRGGGALIVAPSGHGKSVLTAQASIEWGCGRGAFGIRPARPLISLVIQAEDDVGDIAEMCKMVTHLKLSPTELAQIDENVHFEFLNDLTGKDFLAVVDGFLDQYPADLLWINPLEAYLGQDTKDKRAVAEFFRNTLNPILSKHGCAVVVVHHTPKTNFRDTTNWKASDWMYAGSGDAGLTNWARAILVIDPTEVQGTYRFIAAKRGQRIGWGYQGPVTEAFWSHSRENGTLLWIPASEAEIKACGKTEKTEEDLLAILPEGEELTKEDIQELAKTRLALGRDRAWTFLKRLVGTGRVSVKSYPRKGTNPEKKYIKERDTTDP